jgi:hypothetical protein
MSVIYGGYVPQPGRWNANVKLGGVNTPPIEFIMDETLPILGQDLNIPNRDLIVIPRGRCVAPRATDLTRLFGETVLTLANGVDPLNAPAGFTGTIPFGYAPYHLYRNFSGLPADRPLGVLQETIELPYTLVNENYNTSSNGGTRLKVGEWLMPYAGTYNGNAAVPNDIGKFVRWIPRSVFQTNVASASAIVRLPSAPFPSMLPKILIAFDGSNVPVVSGATLAYNAATSQWWATFGNSVKTVIYEYGTTSAQKIAQCIGIEPVSTAGGINTTSHDLAGWLKWVTDNFGAWDWPPILGVNPFSSVTNEVVTITNNAGTLAHNPVIPYKTVTVVVTGTLTDPDGTQHTLTGTTLSLSDDKFFNDQSQGQYYDIDILTGVITFAGNLSVTNAVVSYYYETNFRDGTKYDRGIFGLTDGKVSGITGLPAHLDVAGVVGVMRVMVQP